MLGAVFLSAFGMQMYVLVHPALELASRLEY